MKVGVAEVGRHNAEPQQAVHARVIQGTLSCAAAAAAPLVKPGNYQYATRLMEDTPASQADAYRQGRPADAN